MASEILLWPMVRQEHGSIKSAHLVSVKKQRKKRGHNPSSRQGHDPKQFNFIPLGPATKDPGLPIVP